METCPICGSKMDKDAKACDICGTAFNIDNQVESSVMPSAAETGFAQDIADQVFVDVELEELVKLQGIGPLRAKILFDAGYTDLRKLKRASVVELMNIRGIGRKGAGEIKSALREHTLEEIRETPLTKETVGEENQCPLCATIVSAYETSCYECGCIFNHEGMDNDDSDRLALSYYDSKLLRAPDSKDLWYARGATLVKMGNYEQALSSFNRAIEIDPSFQTAWMSKAEVYNKQGDSARAAECYSHIITSASGGHIPSMEEPDDVSTSSKEDDDFKLEPPKSTEELTIEPEQPDIAEADVTQPTAGPEPTEQPSTDMQNLQMDYNKPKDEKPSLDNMSDPELKRALASRASRIKPYLKLAKEIGVDINHAKKLVARAVSESKLNEYKVAVMLMDEGIEFAENEFRRKIMEDIDNLAAVIRDLKIQGKDVSAVVPLITETKSLLETGNIAESTEKLKLCIEGVERIAQ